MGAVVQVLGKSEFSMSRATVVNLKEVVTRRMVLFD